jgi:hypothetical protein
MMEETHLLFEHHEIRDLHESQQYEPHIRKTFVGRMDDVLDESVRFQFTYGKTGSRVVEEKVEADML